MESRKRSRTSRGEEKKKQVQMEYAHSFVPYHNSPNDQFRLTDENPRELQPISYSWPASQVSPSVPELSSSSHGWPVAQVPFDFGEFPSSSQSRPVPHLPHEIFGAVDDTVLIPKDHKFSELSEDVLGYFEGCESGANGESVRQENVNDFQTFSTSSDTSGFGNPGQLPDWPVLPFPPVCNYCQTLREICHTNGKQVKKLEIHGQLRIFSHAIIRRFDPDLSSQNKDYKIYDFSNESSAKVKAFLVQYHEECRREGYEMIPDPFSDFYRALSFGLIEDNSPLSMLSAGRNEAGPSIPKRDFARQRKRTAEMTLKDFAPYFHLKLECAAEMMDVSTSVIKKKCREGGLDEWPYKRRNEIQKSINILKEKLPDCTYAARTQILEKIAKLEQRQIDKDRELSLLVRRSDD